MVELMTSRPKQKTILERARRHLSRGEEVTGYLCDYFKPTSPEQVRVVIFAQGRTGSTLLENLLCSTGHFQEQGELLNTEYRAEVLLPERFIRGMAKLRSPQNFLFHLKIYHLTADRQRPVDPARFMQNLYAEGWRILYLKRDNKVRHALSNLVAESRNSYFKFDDQQEHLKLTVDCAEFVAWVQTRFHFEAAEQAVLSHIDDFETILYEADLENSVVQQQTVDRILQNLALAPRQARTQTRKINAAPLNELIANYDEFMECVYQHGWQHYLPKTESV